MLKEQKEYSSTLRKENRQQTLGQGQVLETNDVQTNGNVLDDSKGGDQGEQQQCDLLLFQMVVEFLDQTWDLFVQVKYYVPTNTIESEI